MNSDFPTAAVGSSQAPTATVEKSFSALNTKIQTAPEFPNLVPENYQVTSQPTSDYNCIAWAAEEDERWWWPTPTGSYWPSGIPKVATVEAFILAFRTLGYEPCDSFQFEDGFQRVALYTASDGVPTHMARQLPDGTWTSKLGQAIDINHFTLEGLAGPIYGAVHMCMRRPHTQSLLLPDAGNA